MKYVGIILVPTAFEGGCQAALAPKSSSGRHGSKSSLTAEAGWTFLQTVHLIPASILFSYIFAPPTTRTDSFTYTILVLFCLWLRFLLHYVCPCPNRASGKGVAYFLFVFSLFLFLALRVLLPIFWTFLILGRHKFRVVDRLLLVHSAGVTLRPSRHPLLLLVGIQP